MTGNEGSAPGRQKVRVRISTRSHFPRERTRIGTRFWAGVIFGSALLGALAGWQIGRAVVRALEIRKNHASASASWTRPTAAAQFAEESAASPAAGAPAAAPPASPAPASAAPAGLGS